MHSRANSDRVLRGQQVRNTCPMWFCRQLCLNRNSTRSSVMYLVTGGAGFIGSAVVRMLIRRGATVVNVDKLTYAGNLASLSDVEADSRYAFERADIGDADAMRRIFERYQPVGVFHLAAESHVD